MKKMKITRIQKTQEDQSKEKLEKRIEYTYESSNSKISRSESLIVVCSYDTSFGLDVPEEVKSSAHFRFFSTPWAADSARGGDNVESLPSREPSSLSPSWLSLASGALESAGRVQRWWVLLQEEEGEKPKIDGSTKNSTNQTSATYRTKRKQESEFFCWVASRVPLVKGAWSRRKGPDKSEFPFS
jgi:hypothetical protein